MGSGRKLSLPVVMDLLAKGRAVELPRVEQARQKLGGRESGPGGGGTAGNTGRVVTIEGADAPEVGVVLFVSGAEVGVLLPGGVVRRVRAAAALAFSGEVPDDVARLAEDVRRFATLSEGERVAYEVDGSIREGTLVEKCRYGALVVAHAQRASAASPGKLMALGFRKLWPLSRARLGPS